MEQHWTNPLIDYNLTCHFCHWTVTCNEEGSSLLIVKTLDLIAKYTFQLEAYI